MLRKQTRGWESEGKGGDGRALDFDWLVLDYAGSLPGQAFRCVHVLHYWNDYFLLDVYFIRTHFLLDIVLVTEDGRQK